MTSREKKQLPPRVTHKHGAFYYLKETVVDKKRKVKWIRLGTTETAMYQALADMRSDVGTMASIFERYRKEILPKKGKKTEEDQGNQLDHLKKTFGHARPRDIRPMHIAAYHDAVGQKAIYQANRELSLIKHVFKYAVRWGHLDDNPAREVTAFPEKARDRYITDEEFAIVRDVAPPWVSLLMDLSYITGQRRIDLLNIQRKHITDAGILVQQSKTGTKLLIEWTPDLREVVNRAFSTLHKKTSSMYLVCDAKGQQRKDAAFTSAWTRLMGKCMDKGLLEEKFQYRDIRGKAGSDSSGEQLGHQSVSTLNRHYKRLPRAVKPTK